MSATEAGRRECLFMVQRPLLALPNLHLQRKRVYLRAFELHAANPELDFPDVLSVAYMERGLLKNRPCRGAAASRAMKAVARLLTCQPPNSRPRLA